MKHCTSLLLSSAFLAALASTATAEDYVYYSFLDGPQAGTASGAQGSAMLLIDTQAHTLSYTIQIAGLTSAETAAHIRGPAAPQQSAASLHLLAVGTPKIGVWNYPETVEQDLLAGLLYVEIETLSFPGGELRGQLVPAFDMYCYCESGAPCGNQDHAAGCVNSSGSGAKLQFLGGLPSVTLDSLVMVATDMPAGTAGLLLMGSSSMQVPFGDGLRCVGGDSFRFPIQNSGPAGIALYGPGLVAYSRDHFASPGQITAGQTWHFQYWFRDPAGPCGQGFNLSYAIAYAFTP